MVNSCCCLELSATCSPFHPRQPWWEEELPPAPFLTQRQKRLCLWLEVLAFLVGKYLAILILWSCGHLLALEELGTGVCPLVVFLYFKCFSWVHTCFLMDNVRELGCIYSVSYTFMQWFIEHLLWARPHS